MKRFLNRARTREQQGFIPNSRYRDVIEYSGADSNMPKRWDCLLSSITGGKSRSLLKIFTQKWSVLFRSENDATLDFLILFIISRSYHFWQEEEDHSQEVGVEQTTDHWKKYGQVSELILKSWGTTLCVPVHFLVVWFYLLGDEETADDQNDEEPTEAVFFVGLAQTYRKNSRTLWKRCPGDTKRHFWF